MNDQYQSHHSADCAYGDRSSGDEITMPQSDDILRDLFTDEVLEQALGRPQTRTPWTDTMFESFISSAHNKEQDETASPQIPTHDSIDEASDSTSFQHSEENQESACQDPEKRQCFDHGCHGRVFSCRKNYLRHLREKEGKHPVECIYCGLTFTRRSNRDKHLSQGKCNMVLALEYMRESPRIARSDDLYGGVESADPNGDGTTAIGGDSYPSQW